MNILVIGSGGREHALVWKLKQSSQAERIYCVPGNGGISQDAECLPACAENDWKSYAALAKSRNVDMIVVGPEAPLAGGISDVLRSEGLKVFGPSQEAARLEGSKIFSKHFMRKHGIPTADFEAFDEPSKAFDYINKMPLPIVVKADGLAAGKGVAVCFTKEDAKEAVENMMVKKTFGAAGERILIEDALEGSEVSLMALCDGKTIKPLLTARDYKRIFDGNKGPNTGGMGAVSPSQVPGYTSAKIEREITSRFLKGIRQENLDFRGLIYIGLMLTPHGPKVLEFNVRFGDPETEAVLPLVKSDLAGAFAAVADSRLDEEPVEFHEGHCITVVCCSKGYPGKYESGKEIRGLDAVAGLKDSAVFHSGTVRKDGKFYTQGGRVLNCSARGKTFEEARAAAYALVNKISFEGMHYRLDIGGSNAAIPVREPIQAK